MSAGLLAAALPLDLPINPWLAIGLAIAFVLLNGFFVAAEFALVKVRPTQIAPHLASGGTRGRLADQMIRHLDAYLSATQLGITLASLALGWIGEPAFSRLLRPVLEPLPWTSPALVHTISLGVAFGFITFLHIIVGELAPKSLAIRQPTATSLWIAGPLFLFYKITFPLIWALNSTANGLLRMFGVRPIGSEAAQNEKEVRRLLASHRDSEISEDKRELLENIFELSERTARQIMVPRADVVFLSTSQPIEDNLRIARTKGHTRYPLCKTDLDHVSGIVHIKDLFRANDVPTSLEELQRPILFVPETTPADRLLRRMRTEQVHLAAVLDEFGGISGIVTLENVIEEIVGEIQDEFDTEPPEVVELDSGVYLVAGSLLVAELETELGVELSNRDEDTIAGVVLSELGRRARVGDRVELAAIELEVKEIEENRIRLLQLKTLPPVDAMREVEDGS